MIAFSNAFSNNPAQKHQYFVQKKYDNSESILSINYSDVNSRLHETVSDRKMADSGNLGTITKLASTPDFKGLRAKAIRRAEIFALQNEASKLMPSHRINNCLKRRISAEAPVGVKYSRVHKKAYYTNLQRCANSWACSVCAAQITEKRRVELKKGIDYFKKDMCGYVYLLTLTNSHHHGDNLQQLMAGQKKAIKYMWSNRKPKEYFESLGKVGHILANEVTHGKNGWHPHMHILLLFDKPIDIAKLQQFVSKYWQHCCKLAKLKIPSLEHGCDVREGKYADMYIAKWGIEHEMTKGHVKKGREGGNTPFDLLRLSADGCERSGRLFPQFVDAFKGKGQLNWSKGLKKLLLVPETTDEELSIETEEDSVEVREIALEIWRLIILYKARADFLRAIELDEIDADRNYNRADMLVMELAEKYVIEYRDSLMKDADIHGVRSELLKLQSIPNV